MTTGQNILMWTAIVTVCLSSVTFTFLATRKPWIGPPIPGVRLEPTRPILRPEDVKPDSAFGILQQGLDLLEAEGMSDVARDLDELSTTNPSAPEFIAALKKFEPGLALIRKAAIVKEGRQVPFIPELDFYASYLEQSTSACKLLGWIITGELANGDDSGAVRDLVVMLQVADLLSRGGGLNNCWVAQRIGKQSCVLLCAMASRSIAHNALTAGTTLHEVSRLEKCLEPFSEALRRDSTLSSNGISVFYGGPPAWRAACPGKQFPIIYPALYVVGVFLGSTPAETQRNIFSVYTRLIQSYQINGSIHEVTTSLGFLNGPSPWRLVRSLDPIGLALATEKFRGLDYSFYWFCEYQFYLRATCIALAIDHYQDVHEQIPKSIAELVPTYLGETPQDPFRPGQPLLYRVDEGKYWTIYSVGTNGVDDGGVFEADRTEGLDIGISARQFVTATNGAVP